jgi:MPBQ/MSBQ methyltransferase
VESKPEATRQRSSVPGLREKTAVAVNRWYDRRMFSLWAAERYAGSDFHNYGYWTPDTHTRDMRTKTHACEKLMEVLMAFIPHKTGNVLDVACGKGATTRYLLKWYAPQSVTGINISEKQLSKCRINAPMCNFLCMNATDLSFRNNSFDNIICVEAAMHFVTREEFAAEAHRVLKPEGRLVLSDILPAIPRSAENPLCPADGITNQLEYRDLFRGAGFEEVQLTDATHECSTGAMKYSLALLRNKLRAGAIDPATFELQKNKILRRHREIGLYLLVCAQKGAKNCSNLYSSRKNAMMDATADSIGQTS